MDRVLLDGSTLAFAARLLDGEEPPTSVSLFDLALLVESLILHDSVLILDTRGDDELRSYAARYGGEALSVQHRSVRELVDAYVALEVPEVVTVDRTDPRHREAVNEAEAGLRALLDRTYEDDDQIRVCLALLTDAQRAITARHAEKGTGQEPPPLSARASRPWGAPQGARAGSSRSRRLSRCPRRRRERCLGGAADGGAPDARSLGRFR
jgi:hypothetical protein